MKRLLQALPDWLVQGMLLLIFLTTWPLLLTFLAVKFLLSSAPDAEKVSIVKEYFVFVGLLILMILLFGVFLY